MQKVHNGSTKVFLTDFSGSFVSPMAKLLLLYCITNAALLGEEPSKCRI